jgi:membrane protease YdiL (CAAX protease family)
LSEEERPVPSPAGAAVLTLLAWAIATFGWALLAQDAGPFFSLAVGLCLGYGGVGTAAARAVPAPADARLGLRGFAPGLLLPILLLVPAVVLASEIDNHVRPLFPPLPQAPDAPAPEDAEVLRLAATEYLITMVLLRPVLEEFFFRGVIQQGLVAHLGAAAGVLQTAVLGGLASGGIALLLGPDRAASAAAQAAFLGLPLGLLRQVSGSLLAPILAAMAMAGASFVSFTALAERLPIPGFNAPGEHTPPWMLAVCAALAASGAALAPRLGARRPR